MLKITDVQIELITPCNGLIGFASLIIDDCLKLSSIAIYKKLYTAEYRITYPSKGQFVIFHPTNKDTSKAIEQAIFTKLKTVINESCNYDRHNKNSNSI